MAKVIIVIEDKAEGERVSATFSFEPELSMDRSVSPAQDLALRFLNRLAKIEKEEKDKVEGLRNTIRAALACTSEDAIRATLAKIINK